MQGDAAPFAFNNTAEVKVTQIGHRRIAVTRIENVFKNPEGDYAGRLIEQAGLKGLTRGGAMVSPTHANFIVNTGGAEPEDIIALMQEVRERVLTSCGVLLEPEVHIL